MTDKSPQGNTASSPENHPEKNQPKITSRRAFIGKVGAAAGAAAAALAGPSAVSARPAPRPSQDSRNLLPDGVTDQRIIEAFELRVDEAIRDALVPPARNISNGDTARYHDKGGTYTKALPHDAFGRVDHAAFRALETALTTGKFSDFEKIPLGGTHTLNGPQGGLAFDLERLDSSQFGQPEVPPAPATASDQNATELLEHYWASLFRDVAFTDYASSPLAAAAAAELGSQPTYFGPRNAAGQVTPDLLFRGAFAGESLGPYVSQFFLIPAALGAQPMSQQMITYFPNIDYGADFASWLDIQNGVSTGHHNQVDPQLRHMRNGRDLAAFTHVDVLYQAYFTASS